MPVMRLEKIKIAGFKSFVDPTTVDLPSNLVGVIGPNGCGKSNVIDAVRWVMGESSAKMLRGESMADVIFNGSTSRKPVGAASIELVFDNSDGTLGGEYAQYNQVSIRRKVTRDGQSLYFLNSVRCRRRDITDIFLGTGLGPRSYSIIEQGMISRFVEAKPEELRNFLEEAAGISKYKERRRETENRIAHTRENLDRLTDLRDEVAKQLQHLERQAATAEKYKLLKQDERQKKAELLALKLRDLDAELAEHDRQLAELENRLQAAIADQRRLEADLEQRRQDQHDANENFNQVQGGFYAVGADIARLEEAIQFARNARDQQQSDLKQVEQAWQEALQHQQHDQQQQAEIETLLATEEPQLLELQDGDAELVAVLETAESQMQTWQSDWDEFNQQATEPAQVAQIERTRINHIEEQEQQYQQRLAKIQDEQSRLDSSVFEREIDQFNQQVDSAESQLLEQDQQLKQVLDAIQQQRQQNRDNNQQLDQLRTSLQTLKGRLASLEALQQDALGKTEEGLNQWLTSQGIDGAQRLLEILQVEPKWQAAVETVLGYHLQAVCVDQLGGPAASIDALEDGQLVLIDQALPAADPAVNQAVPAGSLLQQVNCPINLAPLLLSVKIADNLSQALDLRAGLQAHESIILADGTWLGQNWLRVNRTSDPQQGMLAREQEIHGLREQIAEHQEQIDQLEAEVGRARETIREHEQQREQHQVELNRLNRQLGDWRANIASRQARVDNIHNRLKALADEQADIQQQVSSGKQLSEQARDRLHQALQEMETHGTQREELVEKREQLREDLQQAREAMAAGRSQTHEAALRIESMRSSLQALQQNLARMTGQLQHLGQRREGLNESLDQSAQPLQQQQQELEALLQKRLQEETRLTEARRELESIDQAVRELDQNRGQAESRVQRERDALTQGKITRQESQVRRQSVTEQIDESGFQANALLENLPEDASTATWHDDVERLERRIARLGPINLAAIDEFKEQTERMEYLDRQHADITESLETLENAIRKIDRETRTRFRETFDTVDKGLKELFPKLFGGGHAYLELTGEDVLDAGVSIMARPPGKRNSSIHLLSGGEKALTAVALVFAIFQINPAPFCMLDEVDAPLDDANVGRFCKMVQEMSEKVQFVFITHNKVTMEIANQLMGVTMHEPGVSRLVSVDIEEAARLAVV